MNSNASSSSDHYFKSTLFPNKKRWHHLRYMWPEAAAVNTVEKEEAARWKLVHFRFPAFENTKREDVVRCFDSLSVKRNQRPITIAFVGDSTARQHYLSLIRVSTYSYTVYYIPFHFTHILLNIVLIIIDGSWLRQATSKSLQHRNSRETLSRRLEFDQSSDVDWSETLVLLAKFNQRGNADCSFQAMGIDKWRHSSTRHYFYRLVIDSINLYYISSINNSSFD